MSSETDSEIAVEEEKDESIPSHPTFGHEYLLRYSGEPMDKLDTINDTDQENGHLILPVNFILDHRYQVKSLIGRGTFCLVWFAFDHLKKENVAIKILRNNEDDLFEDEYILNRYLSDEAQKDDKIVVFYRMFYHNHHPCLVFELAAQNILTFLSYFDEALVPIPMRLIKKIVRDTLLGLNFMHKLGVIHTDLKPENIMCNRPLFPYHPFPGIENIEVFNALEDDPDTVEFKLGDIGNSCFIDYPLNDLIQTRQYRSPEVLLGLPYDTSADIWSLACMIYELATKQYLFDPAVSDFEEETNETRHIFDSVHLSMIESCIGPIQDDWAREGSHYEKLYQPDGDLKYKCAEQMPCIYYLLKKNDVPEIEAQKLADFLESMLAIIPAQRPSAEELLESPWLFD